jgi:hypothetical protein
MARAKSISIPVTGNTAPLRKALKDAQKDLTAFGKAQQQWAAASSLAYGVVGTAAFQFGMDAVKAAIEDQKAQALLADQLEKTLGANTALIASTESYIETLMLATNVGDDKLRPALASLVRVTGDLTKSQNLLGIAVDLSTATGKDLEAVTTALGKAAMGQTTALSRLGVGLSQATLAGGDFNAILREITAKTGGAAAAALDTTAGKVQNLGVRFDELKEQLGTELLPVVETVADRLLGVADAVQEGDYVKAGTDAGFSATKFVRWATGINLVSSAIQKLNPFADEAEKKILATGTAADFSAAKFRILDEATANLSAGYDQMRMKGDDYQKSVKDFLDSKAQERYAEIVADYQAKQDKAAAATAAATTKQREARKTYQETAKALREALNTALDDSRKKLKDAKDAAQDFGDSFAYQFGVSLAGAYDKAKDSETNYTDALKDRKDAYDALDIAAAGTDLNAYLRALKDVKTAEDGVTTAQKARVSPAAAFADQIAAAKTFGTNLQTLVGQGLGKAGLQQLLDLGPTVGAQVTKEILAGTAGFTVGSLNEDLSALAGVQAGLSSGVTAALGGSLNTAVSDAQFMTDLLSSASISAPGVGQGMQIVVNAGVGDPVAIGAQVKSVLQSYDQRAGKLTVQGPKKKAKKK